MIKKCNPMFSILIPVYNVEKYLRKCLDSVLSQTFKDFEVIVTDDGSTDKSGKICDEYAAFSPEKISVHHRRNKGLLLTRREQINFARGEYIIFVDSDDWIERNLLQSVNNAIEKYNCDVVMYDYFRVYPNGECLKSGIKLDSGIIYEGKKKSKVYEYFLLTNKINNMWSKAVRRSIIDVKTDYSEFPVTLGEDALQTLPILTNAKSIIYISEVLYNYRKDIASMTGSMKPEYLQSFEIQYNQTIHYVEKWNINYQVIEVYKANWAAFLINSFFRTLAIDKMAVQKISEQLCESKMFCSLMRGIKPYYFSNNRIAFRTYIFGKLILNGKTYLTCIYLRIIRTYAERRQTCRTI